MGFGGFSWKRALGVTKAKQKISRSIGIPLTKSGRQRKFGAMIGGGILGAVPTSSKKRKTVTRSENEHRYALTPEEKALLKVDLTRPYGINEPPPSQGFFDSLLGHAKKREEEQLQQDLMKTAVEVALFERQMNEVQIPGFGPFSRGSDTSREQAESIIENHLRVLGVVRSELSGDALDEVENLFEKTAKIRTLKDAVGQMRPRAEDILHWARMAKFPEAEYLISGIWDDSNMYVLHVRELAKIAAADIQNNRLVVTERDTNDSIIPQGAGDEGIIDAKEGAVDIEPQTTSASMRVDPLSSDEIKVQIEAIGEWNDVRGMKPMAALPEHMAGDEVIQALEPVGSLNDVSGIVFITNKKVFVLGKKWFGGIVNEEVLLSDITGFAPIKGTLFMGIRLVAGEAEHKITMISKRRFPRFRDVISAYVPPLE